ncbi:hypothetical protein BDW62DRAFT_198988 [Aspergillus aurantiobrunneus]
MPIPLYTDQSQTKDTAQNNAQSSTQGLATTGTTNNNDATTTSLAGNDFSSAVNEHGQPLSKEEADRLYEERMEEEYAKREGGNDMMRGKARGDNTGALMDGLKFIHLPTDPFNANLD